MTKKLSVAIALVIACFGMLTASPYSYLDQSGWYFSTRGSVSIPTDAQGSFTGNDVNESGDIELKNGFGLSGAIGYHIADSWRLEAEYSYRSNDTDRYRFNSGSLTGATGDIEHHAFMINLLYDANIDLNWYIYTGLGFGLAWSSYQIDSLGEDAEFQFAYQAMLGLGYRINSFVSMQIGYRLFSTLDTDYHINGNNVDLETPFLHTFEVGFQFDF